MKKRYFTALLAGLIALGAAAQTQFTVLQDMTSKLQNADFKSGSPVAYTVRTYDYDIPDQIGAGAGGEGLYGQQEVPGWTAAAPSDNCWMARDARTDGSNARAAGIFAYDLDSEIGLGGDYFPRIEGGDTQGLGMVAVWGASLQYSQNVTLPAGDYLLIARLCNVAGDGTIDNLFGFKTADDTYYQSTMTNVPIQAVLESEGKDIWVEDTVVFRLTAETAGDVILGYSYSAGSGTAPHIFLDNVKLLKVDPSTLDKLQIEAARADLQKLVDEGKRLGVDTSASEALLANANATLSQLSDAIAHQEELNAEAVTDLSEFFIMNPHFSQDDPITDGICTYAKDMTTNDVTHYGMQPVKSWVANHPESDSYASGVLETGSTAFIGGKGFTAPATLSDGTVGKLLGFVTCWTGSIQYTQHVLLPAGSYTLNISYYNSGGAQAVAKNLIGFIADDGTEYLGSTLTFPVGQWGTETITFELSEETEGNFSLGYTSTNTGSGNMPHFFLDGISLLYEGELQFDPSLLALQGVVNNAENYVYQVFYQDLKNNFESVLDEGRSLVSSQSNDTAANKAAQEKITAMLQDVMASIADYERLQKFYDTELVPAEEKFDSQQSIKDRLIALDDEIYDALQSGEWDKAKIDEVIASLPAIIKEEIQAAWDNAIASGSELDQDLDISPLFDTLGVTYSATAQSGNNVPDKQWSYGSASNFKTQFGTAEVWNQSPFTVSQTLTELPAGTYTVTTRAFYRTSDNVTNYSNYDPSATYAYIFAGNNRTPLTNIVEVASAEEVSGWADAGGVYVPNSQQAAHDLFENAEYIAKVTSSTKTVLTETGDLTFGITADQMEGNSWVVWYTFEIAYNAVDESILDDELQALIDQADVLVNNTDNLGIIYVGQTTKDLNAAIKEGQTALNGTTDDKKAAMSTLKTAIAGVSESAQLMQRYMNEATAVSDMINSGEEAWDFTSNNTELLDVIGDIEGSFFADNAALQKAIDELPTLVAKYVLGRNDFADGSQDNPIDITGLIMNYSFNTNASNWTIVGTDENGRIGQNQGYQSASYTNEADGYVIDHFVEAWRPNGAILNDGTISQQLAATLPAGYYRLECDGYATNQAEIPGEGIQGVGLYAQCGDTWDWTPMGISETAGTPRHFARDFKADGTSPVTVGVRVQGTNASWLAADNFRLYYIGTEAPDAIDAIADSQAAKSKVYNLAGQRVNKAARGIFIVDGKKVVVK